MTESELRAAGLENIERAQRAIHELAGQGVTDDELAPLLPLLTEALRGSPDPDRALTSFARWFRSVGSRYSHLQTLLRHPIALDLFCLVTGSSQYFADLMVRNPEYFEIIANPGVRGGTKSTTTFYREISALVAACLRPELKRDALRRWKAREMLRIGVRDLVGLADMPATAREFSNLADACVQCALDITRAALPTDPQMQTAAPFAVIGMGKLGGQELNYSSDIDLIFVHGDNLPERILLAEGRTQETTAYLNRLAETLVKTLAEETAQGHVFRVDMRLRPEGRFGPLTRSLASCKAYYESWAENWERQAMLKARFLAGDRVVGEAFIRQIEPFVYRRHNSVAFLDDIRDNKRKIEKKCALEGETYINIKTGFGGIRDIEFITQILQLEFGGRAPRLRSPNTLSALNHLRHAGLLTDSEAAELAEDYRFLRTLEHRLQLLNGFQTQTLPPPEQKAERARIARRMGYLDRETFEADLQRRRKRVHAHLQRLFYREAEGELTSRGRAAGSGYWSELNDLLDTLETPAAQDRLKSLLTGAGFRDFPAALNALQLPMRGNQFGEMPPDTPVEFQSIAPRLMELLARSPDPDAGLAGIELLATAVPNRAQLYASFDDSPDILRKTVRLAASSPHLLKRLTRHLEWMEPIFSEEEGRQEGSAELADRLRLARDWDAKLESIARYHQREILRIGAQDLWEETDVLDTMAALSRLASDVLGALMAISRDSIAVAQAEPEFARRAMERVTALGLGKLGGAEVGYGSDWDVVFGYDEAQQRGEAARSGERFALASALVERVNAAVRALAARGAAIELDLRLRPWGQRGAVISSLRSALTYYRETGETWERQAVLKARYIAGNRAVGERFVRILQAASFGRPWTPEHDAEVRAMKRRIETERLKPDQRETDVKLGHGGLSDIEWLAQLLQLQQGGQQITLRVPGTLSALSALASARLLDNAEVDMLTATYLFLTRVRNALWLQSGASLDALPSEPFRLRALARLLGYGEDRGTSAEERLREDIHAHMTETRRIFLRRFEAY
jgi:glutamate-ammonia-ligase adenylyltransferase